MASHHTTHPLVHTPMHTHPSQRVGIHTVTVGDLICIDLKEESLHVRPCECGEVHVHDLATVKVVVVEVDHTSLRLSDTR